MLHKFRAFVLAFCVAASGLVAVEAVFPGVAHAVSNPQPCPNNGGGVGNGWFPSNNSSINCAVDYGVFPNGHVVIDMHVAGSNGNCLATNAYCSRGAIDLKIPAGMVPTFAVNAWGTFGVTMKRTGIPSSINAPAYMMCPNNDSGPFNYPFAGGICNYTNDSVNRIWNFFQMDGYTGNLYGGGGVGIDNFSYFYNVLPSNGCCPSANGYYNWWQYGVYSGGSHPRVTTFHEGYFDQDLSDYIYPWGIFNRLSLCFNC